MTFSRPGSQTRYASLCSKNDAGKVMRNFLLISIVLMYIPILMLPVSLSAVGVVRRKRKKKTFLLSSLMTSVCAHTIASPFFLRN